MVKRIAITVVALFSAVLLAIILLFSYQLHSDASTSWALVIVAIVTMAYGFIISSRTSRDFALTSGVLLSLGLSFYLGWVMCYSPHSAETQQGGLGISTEGLYAAACSINGISALAVGVVSLIVGMRLRRRT